jgi:hypothetical protein
MTSRFLTQLASGVVLAIVAAASVACSDNATGLAFEIERAAATVATQDGVSVTAHYEPVTGSASPYVILFFPSRPVTGAELVTAGVPETTVRRILSELAYLGNTSNLLVVDQDGERLAFTTYWRRTARVRDLVVSPLKKGPSEILVMREGGTNWVVAIK